MGKIYTTKARLNPFLFSPNTNFRFALLILSVIGASLFIYETLFFQKSSNEVIQIIQSCKQEADSVYPISGDTSIEQKNSWIQYGNVCREGFEQEQAKWILGNLGFLFLVAGVVYLFTPRWRIWRDELTVFSADDDPEIMKYLIDLCGEAKLSKPPRFLLRALNPSPSGLAFGHLGNYFIVFNGGLLPLFHQSPERFRAIVSHELAHLQNKDVDKTYFSVALGISFLIVGLVPLLLSTILSNLDIGAVFGLIVRAILFSTLVYITLSSVLRSREVYADARASENHETYVALSKELSSLPVSKNTIWKSLFGLHPISAWRLKILDDPALLFQLSYLDAFTTGIVATFGLLALSNFLSTWLSPDLESNTAFISILFLISPAVFAVGIGIWQRVFASLISNEIISGIGRLGLSLSFGMLLGFVISFSSNVSPFTESWQEVKESFSGNELFSQLVVQRESLLPYGFTGVRDIIANGIFQLSFGLLLVVSLFLIFRWIALSALIWLETVSNQKDLRGLTFFGLLITACVISLWISGLLKLQQSGYEFVLQLLSSFDVKQKLALVVADLSNPTKWLINTTTSLTIYLGYLVPFLTFLWVYPLAGRIRKPQTKMQNPFIGGDGMIDLPAKRHPFLRPFRAFLAGFGIAFGFILFVIFLRMALRFSVAESVRTTLEWSVRIKLIQIYTAVFLQVGLTIFVSAFYKQLGWAHGLFAAFVAGCLIQIAIVGLYELGDCFPILSLTRVYSCWNPLDNGFGAFDSIIILGSSFSFPLALIASWIGSSFRNVSSKPSLL